MKKKYSRAFTLIELMVVISVISGLSSIVLAATSGVRSKARDSYRVSQIHEVQQALALYYSAHGQYPPNTNLTTYMWDTVPHNWSDMIQALSNEGFISATFSVSKADIDNQAHYSFINIANATVGGHLYNCSIQDPMYKSWSDFQYSYGYVASSDQQSYKIRVYLENTSDLIFNSSLTGAFLDPSATIGNTACDKDYNYYCVGSI
jgi:prepilin-type N-terminal cleavage/methylation domain-containing protein